MPRTTLNLDPDVLRRLRDLQQREGRPLGDLVSELVARALAAAPAREPEPLSWAAKPMRARIDLDNREAVWAVLDEPG